MGCGISKLERHGAHHHHHDLITTNYLCESNSTLRHHHNDEQQHHGRQRGMHESEDDMKKEKERSGLVEKVKERKMEGQLLPSGKKARHDPDFVEDRRRRHNNNYNNIHEDDDYDDPMLFDNEREDSLMNYPRSPSFRDYCINDYEDPIIIDDHAANGEINKSETSAESWNTNKVQGFTEADELVKKESKRRSSSGFKGVLSRGKQSRIRSYLNVSNWHNHNNPISSSQQNPQKLVAGN